AVASYFAVRADAHAELAGRRLREARREATYSALAQGQNLFEQGEGGRGLLWLARAPGGAARARGARPEGAGPVAPAGRGPGRPRGPAGTCAAPGASGKAPSAGRAGRSGPPAAAGGGWARLAAGTPSRGSPWGRRCRTPRGTGRRPLAPTPRGS